MRSLPSALKVSQKGNGSPKRVETIGVYPFGTPAKVWHPFQIKKINRLNSKLTTKRGKTLRALVQRVSHASVTIDGRLHGQIGQGFLVLLGITDGDTVNDAVYLADKTVKMRVFTDENDKMNRSLADVGGGLLIVSQFTLYGDCRKGNRPSFTSAARPETAIPLYEAFIARCRESGLPVETGEFGADMKVDLLNDGPVTLWMDTKDMRR